MFLFGIYNNKILAVFFILQFLKDSLLATQKLGAKPHIVKVKYLKNSVMVGALPQGLLLQPNKD